MKKMYREILSKLKAGRSAVLLSVIKSSGSVPRKIGAKMACFDDLSTVGTVGGGAVEHDAMLQSKKLCESAGSLIKNYTLNHADAAKIGMVCGGEVTIHFAVLAPSGDNIALIENVVSAVDEHKKAWLVTNIDSGGISLYCQGDDDCCTGDVNCGCTMIKSPTLCADEKLYIEPLYSDSVVYVFGGGHVSQALCPMLCATDFRVVVYEDNEQFAKKELFCEAERVVCADFLDINENISITDNDYAVVLTRGHKSDNEVVRQILSKNPSYLGVIGSKKKVQFMHDYLINCGFDEKAVSDIRSPIGLEIGAVTPAEIAVSITAQLIEHRANKG